MDPALRDFWQFHASLMEPWDGPACVTFTDGTVVGAVLGPQRITARHGGGALSTTASSSPARAACSTCRRPQIVAKGRLEPGRMFLIDTAAGRIVHRRRDQDMDSPVPIRTASGCTPGCSTSTTLPDRGRVQPNHESVVRRQIAFGYTEEDLRILLTPDGGLRGRAARLDGHRHPDGGALASARAALRLLRRTLRAGDQSAAGRDPRRGRHLDLPASWAPSRTCSSRPPRRAARSCCAGPCSTTTNSTRSSTSTTTANTRA